jgi:hypothetical protein
LIESLALNIFHDEKEHSVRTLSEVRNIDDVGMLDGSCGPGLTLEARDRFTFLHVLVTEDIGPDGLYRNPPGDQILIACKVNLPHRSPANSLGQQVTS